MSTALIDTKGKNQQEIEALEVAEAARETEWKEPSFVADLFMGRLRDQAVLTYPEQSAEDKAIGDAYLAKIDAFLKEHHNAEQVDETGEIPPHVMKGLADLGCFGMKIPKEYGGLGLSQINYNRALALISGHCGSTGALLSAHQSIGVPQPLRLFGTEEQKKKYLPRFARGEVSAFALTEPNVGSDPARMSTTATPSEDGSHYILNGTKLWCTNGVIASVIVVMAKTPSVMVNGREKTQITAFILETNSPGFEVLHRCRFLGLNGVQNGLLKFTNIKIPKENIIWGLGKGLRLALITLNAGRLSIPASCIGGGRQGLAIMREWGNERVQWGAPVGKHEAGALKIARYSANLFAMEAITWLSGIWVDRKSHDIRLEAAMCKVFCSETAHYMVEEALQFRAGRGYERSSSLRARGEKPYPIERMLRDSRINQIVEGTSDILRLFIAREALDKHLSVAGAVLNPRLSIQVRLTALVKSVGFYSWWYPMQWLGPLLVRLSFVRYAQLGKLVGHMIFAKCASHRLARTTFHLMLLNGPGLEKRQAQLSRLVEIATDLFAMAATIGRAQKWQGKNAQARVETTDGGVETANAVDLADLFCRETRKRINRNFKLLWCNTDKLHRRVSKQVLEGKYDWLQRERLGQL